MVILQNVSSPELMDKLRKICMSLNVEYLQDTSPPKGVENVLVWDDPPDEHSSSLKRYLVGDLIRKGIINEPIAWFIYKEISDIGIKNPGVLVKKLILSLVGDCGETLDESISIIVDEISSWQVPSIK